jgi:DNA ligase D-like protein (predicted polymerase)
VAYTVCNDVGTLEWLGNQAALEFHPAPVRRDRLERPDLLVVDIDPPEEAFDAAVEVAGLVLEVLDDLGLRPLLKTTGGKGLHVMVPIVRHVAPEELRHAATRLTELVVDRRPQLVTAEFRKAERKGRVMLDPSRNGPGATIVAPYSPRARADATVSFPLVPADLRSIAPGDFTVATARRRLRGAGPRAWARAAEERPQRLPRALLTD